MKTPYSPKKITWVIGLILGALGIIGHYAHVQIFSEYNYPLLLVGFLVLQQKLPSGRFSGFKAPFSGKYKASAFEKYLKSGSGRGSNTSNLVILHGTEKH